MPYPSSPKVGSLSYFALCSLSTFPDFIDSVSDLLCGLSTHQYAYRYAILATQPFEHGIIKTAFILGMKIVR